MDAIGIDIGSTNVKVAVVAPDGSVRAVSQHPLAWARHGDVAEQDPEALWRGVLDGLAALAAALGPEGLAGVGTVGICGQYSSIVPVDGHGLPLAPMRLYLDQRGTSHCRAVLDRHPDAAATWMERHPIPPLGGGLALGHVLAFQHDEPAIHAAAAAYLEPVDYVAARLTGAIAATQASAFAGQLVDNRTLDATGYDPELVALAGVDADRLPPLVPAGSVVGAVGGDARRAGGLGPAVAVVAGIPDSSAAALATGADRPGRVGIAIGTTAVVLASVDHLGADFDHEVVTMPGITPGRYLVSAENGLAGRAVEHVLRAFVHVDDALGAHGAEPFTGFEAALAASPAGARGVRFLPWLSGAMAPRPDARARGGFVGVSLESERVDLVRAAAEGVAHNLAWLLGPVEAFTAGRAEFVTLCGGAVRSPAWCQVIADVLQRPVHTLAHADHGGARAVALWALARLGEAGGDEDLLVTVADRYHPDPVTAEVHERGGREFVAAFDALRPLRLGRSGDGPGPGAA